MYDKVSHLRSEYSTKTLIKIVASQLSVKLANQLIDKCDLKQIQVDFNAKLKQAFEHWTCTCKNIFLHYHISTSPSVNDPNTSSTTVRGRLAHFSLCL